MVRLLIILFTFPVIALAETPPTLSDLYKDPSEDGFHTSGFDTLSDDQSKLSAILVTRAEENMSHDPWVISFCYTNHTTTSITLRTSRINKVILSREHEVLLPPGVIGCLIDGKVKYLFSDLLSIDLFSSYFNI